MYSDFTNNPKFKEHESKSYTATEWFEIIAELSSDEDPSEINRKPGRPSKYSYDLGKRICSSIVMHGTMKPILEKEGLCRTTVWRWREKYPSFRDMYTVAMRLSKENNVNSDRKKALKRRITRGNLQRKKARINSPVSFGFRGRNSLYKPEYCELVGSSYAKTAKAIGVCRRTVINWSKKYPEFGRCQALEYCKARLSLINKRVNKIGKQVETFKHP